MLYKMSEICIQQKVQKKQKVNPMKCLLYCILREKLSKYKYVCTRLPILSTFDKIYNFLFYFNVFKKHSLYF